MGVALVNLVWRRLAVVPSVLHGSWQTLKPHYQSGVIPAAAWQLRQELEVPLIESINGAECDSLAHELKDASVIDEILRTYERGNAQNLIALCYLQMALDASNPLGSDPSGSKSSPDNSQSSVTASAVAHIDRNQSADEKADSHFGVIPDLPRLNQLPDDIQSLVARASLTWIPAEYPGLMPSVFRHFAYWPGLLLLITNRLETMERKSSHTIAPLATQVLELASSQAAMMGEAGASLNELNDTDRKWLQEVLDVFIEVMMARGVVIVPSLRSLLSFDERPNQ